MKPLLPTQFLNPFGFKIPTANEQALGRIPWQYNETQWETTSKTQNRTLAKPPFHVELEVNDALQFEFVFYLGYVYELVSNTPLQLIVHKPTNFDVDPPLNRLLVSDGSLYVKVLLSPNGAITGDVEVIQLELEPPDEEGVLHYKLASVGDDVDGRPPLELFLSGSHICYARNTLETKHPFKVTPTGNAVVDEETEEPVVGTSEYEVYFGIAGGIPLGIETLAVADTHYIYVEFTRDPSSRVITAATLTSAETIPDSDYNSQYVKIAKVNAGDIIQHRFEDIRINELLIVDAGEFKLVSVFDTTNFYSPP